MKNKKILLISIFILMIVLSIAAVSAEDADDAIASSDDEVVLEDSEPTISGTVSGGVDVVTENPNEYSGELSYDVPNDAKTIKSADVYVNIYGVTTDDRYGANINTTIKSDKGNSSYYESLCYANDEEDHSIVHNINDHVNKVYLNYMIHYNVKDLLSGLNGTSITIHVDSLKMEGKSFDGKIKLIALVLAYNDDSTDEYISYWVNDNQLWTKGNVTLKFDTEGKSGVSTLTNIVLSSSDGAYTFNGEILDDADTHVTGSTYQYNQWDVTGLMDKTKNSTLNVAASSAGWASLRNSLSILTISDICADVGVKTEYTSVPCAYAGTNNTLAVSINTNKAGKYTVRLLADGVVVSETEAELISGSNNLLLTDPTIRAVDESTVNGADNNKVNYTVELLFNDYAVNSTSISVPVLYNGNLGKDLAYPSGGFDDVVKFVVNGDIVIDVKDVGSYLGASAMNRTDVWTLGLGEDSSIVKSYVYVPYNWFNTKLYTEDVNMFNVTFNGAEISPCKMIRDQGNLGNYGGYGYGVLIYDVTDLVNKSGSNTLKLNKRNATPAVYPSIFVYMYNTTGSDIIKEIYLTDGADLLANVNNNAGRVPKADSNIDVVSKLTLDATLCVFAASAQAGEGNIVFNGEEYSNVWSGTSSTTDLFTADVTGKVKDSNSISFVATGSTILALQQMIVLTKDANGASISLAPEYTSVPSAYAGTNNLMTITVDVVKGGKYTIELYADGVLVNSTEKDLLYGQSNKLSLIDPTIRDVDETTVNGAANNKVNYTVKIISEDGNTRNASVALPVLYNGNLGKDFAYPAGGYESFLNITINGDIVIDVKDVGSYLAAAKMNRTDVWTTDLGEDSSIVKSYIYIPYNWFNAKTYTEDENMFNVTFNGVKVAPDKMYRDQGNLGNYGKYGYGVLVYDVTDLVNKSGSNTLVLNKNYPTPAVYPSVFVYMYNTTGSEVVKNVYIVNGADLLAGTSNNLAGRIVKADSTIDVAVEDAAKLYIFAASAQAGEGNIVFNGDVYENVWNGTSSTTDLYALDITDSVKNTNNISFVATGSTILALQQIIVVTKKINITADQAIDVTNPADTNAPTYSINMPKDAKGKLTVSVDGKVYETKELVDGSASITVNGLSSGDHNIVVSYSGDDNYLPITKSTTVNIKEEPKPSNTPAAATTPKVTTKETVKIVAKNKKFKAKAKVKKYTITLKAGKKPVKKVVVTLKIKGKTYKVKTNAKGKATFKIKKLTKKGKYTAVIKFAGNSAYKKATKKVKIIVK